VGRHLTIVEHVVAEGPSAHSPSHFLGAIVIQQQENPPGSPQQFIVIDGQQRLTTLQLLVGATARTAEQLDRPDVAELLGRFIYNTPLLAKGDERFKVWPTNANRRAFATVMRPDGDPQAADDDPDNEIQEAHAFFHDAVRAWATEDGDVGSRLDALRVALSDLLKLVAIRLEDGDNPQVIFETLNARGTPLIALDLLKNAVFLAASREGADTDRLYLDHWAPELDREFWRSERRAGRLFTKNGDLFLQYWLVAELASPLPVTELFDTFRTKVLQRAACPPMSELIPMVSRDAAVVRGFDSWPPGSAENRFFSLVELLDTGTFMPLALTIIRPPEVIEARRHRSFAVLEDFLVRRWLCGWTTKNYNRLAASLVAIVKEDIERADEVLEARLDADRPDESVASR
jgi:hypothetical protein